MKTILLSILFAACLQTISAQEAFASADGVPPHNPGTESIESTTVAEPSVSTYSHTVNDIALVSLGKGFRQAVNLQVLTPSTEVLINKEIEAGQTRVKIDLSGMENGTYTVRIKAGDKTWVRQVVKG